MDNSPDQDLIDLKLKDLDVDRKKRVPAGQHLPLKARVEAIASVAEAEALLEELLELIAQFPGDEKPQRLVAAALSRIQDARAAAVWRGIDRRFPESDTAAVRITREIYRNKGLEAAEAYIQQRLMPHAETPLGSFMLARAYIEVRRSDVHEKYLRCVLAHGQTNFSLLRKTSKLLIKQGLFGAAEEAVQLINSRFGETAETRQMLAEIENLRRLTDSSGRPVSSVLTAVISKILEAGAASRPPALPSRPKTVLGSVVMINGSLGPGGAERQFVETARGLQRVINSGEPVAGITIRGPVTLISRSLSARADDDFYLPHLRQAGLHIHEYTNFEPFGGDLSQSLCAPVHSLIRHLPARTQEGIERLADTLRRISPDIVHIWQDGSILATGLAAILANVPRIVLGVRTMPPIKRHDREKPEYYPIFKGLLSQPGVIMLSNAKRVSDRYADWLEIDRGDVRVIPNGVIQPDPTPTPRSAKLLQALPPPDQRFVVGGVMRLAEVKRPLLWLDCAAAILRRCPDAYFLLVGRGPLLSSAKMHARSLGIAERLIMPGATQDIGYWYTQMDVHLLLSRYEGLPNVLIEAQMSGVPVVATPAGGASETVVPGITGTILHSIEAIKPEEVADAVLAWRRHGEAREDLRKKASQWARSQFSLERMIALTMKTYAE